MKTVKDDQSIVAYSGKTTGQFWLMAGAVLLTWQINNQVVQADVTPVPQGTPATKVGESQPNSDKLNQVTTSPAQMDSDEVATKTPAPQSSPPQSDLQDNTETTVKDEGNADDTPDAEQNDQLDSDQPQTEHETEQSADVNEQAVKGQDVQAPTEVVQQTDDVTKPDDKEQPAKRSVTYRAAAVPPQTDTDTDEHLAGTWGTCKWNFDPVTRVLHIGAGTTTDTGVKVNAQGQVTDWGELDWHNYKDFDNGYERSYVIFDGKVVMGADASYAFSNFTILDESQINTNLITDNTTNMTGMFANGIGGHSVNLSLNTKKVTTMAHMFDTFRGAQTLNLKGFDTSQVTDMSYMFHNNFSIFFLNLGNFNTTKVTNMAHMFDGCNNLESADISSFDTSNVTNMASMFNDAVRFGTIDVSHFDTHRVTNMSGMFKQVGSNPAFKTVIKGLNQFATENVTDMSSMFERTNASAVDRLDLSQFDTSKVTNMANMFARSVNVVGDYVNKFDTSKVTNMTSMFLGVADVEKLDLSNFDTTLVTNMVSMFGDMTKLTSLNLAGFDTSNVTDMSRMFDGTTLLVQLNLQSFDTSKVQNMVSMFANMTKLTSLNLTSFDTSNVTDMSGMFDGAASLIQLNIQNFNTSKVQNMALMFANMTKLASVNLTNFDTANVTDMSGMFSGAAALSQLDLHNFDTANVTDMSGMFNGAAALSQLDLHNFNTANVVDMSQMFMSASKLSQLDLSNFNTDKLQNMTAMFVNDGALQKLDLSSFNMTNVELNNLLIEDRTYIRTLSIFNLPEYFAYMKDYAPTRIKVLTLGKNTLLYRDVPLEKVEDIIYNDTMDYPTMAELLDILGASDVEELKLWFFSANLRDAGGRTGMWVNIDTGKKSTAPELMGDVGDDRDTIGTWIWQNITGKDAVLIASPKTQWSPEDNFDLALDEKWSLLALDQLTVTVRDKATKTVLITINPKSRSALNLTDAIDFSHPGEYEVLYSYDGADGLPQSSGPVNLIVIPSQAAVKAHNSIIQLGDDWQVDDNLHGAVNADGSRVDISEVTMSGMVKTQVPGIYQVTYQFTDKLGMFITKTIQVIVNGLTIKQDTANFSTDDRWNPQTNVAAAMDDQGRVVSPEQVTIILTNSAGQVVTNLKRPGQYSAIYRFNDGHGAHTQTANITVTAGENFADLKLKTDHTALYEGDVWDPFNYVQLLVDSDGEQISQLDWPHRLQVDGTVNTNQAGDYQLTYHFTDLFGERHQAKLMVTVNPNQAGLVLNHDVVTLYVGSAWQAEANVVSATDVDGQTIPLNQITISSNLDLTQPGSYLVTYRFTDQQRRLHTATTVVKVVASQADLTVKADQVKLYVGATWQPMANLASVTDTDGSAIDRGKVKVTSNVDLTRPGHYSVTYRFTDSRNVEHTATTAVNVLENQAALVLKKTSVQLTIGETWDATANVLRATDVDGVTIDADSLQIKNPIVVTQSGTYLVTYQFTDQLGVVHMAQAQVTLKDKEQPGGGGQTPEPTPEPKPTPENPEQPVTPTAPDKQPSAESSKQQPTEGAGEAAEIKTSPQPQIQAVQPAQSAIKLEKGLPQTDEQPNKQVSIIGLIALALSSLGLPWLIKGKGNQRKRTK